MDDDAGMSELQHFLVLDKEFIQDFRQGWEQYTIYQNALQNVAGCEAVLQAAAAGAGAQPQAAAGSGEPATDPKIAGNDEMARAKPKKAANKIKKGAGAGAQPQGHDDDEKSAAKFRTELGKVQKYNLF